MVRFWNETFLFLTEQTNNSVKNFSLAAISTLYFVEHSKQIDRQYFQQIDRQYFDSHLESNALINSSFPINGGGFGNNIDDSINYRNHMPKKVKSIPTLPVIFWTNLWTLFLEKFRN